MRGICKCGHNRSFHALEWNRLRGVWATDCRSMEWGRSGSDRCHCGEFNDDTEEGA